jgi:hypothetical protein
MLKYHTGRMLPMVVPIGVFPTGIYWRVRERVLSLSARGEVLTTDFWNNQEAANGVVAIWG